MRKRVIKLLKSFYTVTQDNNRKTDIATRMVLRMMDEDDSVKELATKTIEELWFPSTNPAPAIARGRSVSANHLSSDKHLLLAKVIVIMGTAAHFKDRQSPLEDLLHKIVAEKSENEVAALHGRYSEICETLIDGLVDATDLPGFVSPSSLDLVLYPNVCWKDCSQLYQDHLSVHFCISPCSFRHERIDTTSIPQECFDSEQIYSLCG